MSVVLIGRQFLHDVNSPQKETSRLLLVVFAAAVMPLVVLSLLPQIVAGQYVVRPEYAFLPFVLVPLGLGYGFFRHEVWGIRGILRRGLVYVATGGVVASLYVLVLDAVARQAALPDDETPMLVAALLAGAALPVMWWYLARWLDRYVYGDAYAYREVLLELTDAVSRSASIEDLD